MADMNNPINVLTDGLKERPDSGPVLTPSESDPTPKVESRTPQLQTVSPEVVKPVNQINVEESRNRLKAVNPSSGFADGFQDEFKGVPSFFSGVASAWKTGLTSSLYTAILDGTEQDERPEDVAAKAAARTTILHNVPAQYHDEVMAMPNVESALRKSQEVRDRVREDAYMENMDGLSYLGAHITGFLLDPSNIFVAAKAVQGANAISKLAMGVKGASSLGGKVTSLAVAGGIEETIRNVPRLSSDPTYDVNRYWTDAAIGVAFGAALPVLGTAAKPATKALFNKGKSLTSKINDDLGEAAHNLHMDVAAKHVMYTVDELVTQAGKSADTAAAKSTVNKLRDLDVGTAIAKGKQRAQESVDHSLRKFKTFDLTAAVKESLEGNTQTLKTALDETQDNILNQLKKTATNKQAADDLIAKTQREREFVGPIDPPLLTREAGTFKPELETPTVTKSRKASTFDPKDAGAAARKTTLSDKVGDVKHDIEVATKEMFRDAEAAYTRIYETLSDSNLAKLYDNNVPQAAKDMAQRIKDAADVSHTAARNQMDETLERIGKPRTRHPAGDDHIKKSINDVVKTVSTNLSDRNARLIGSRTLPKLPTRMRNSLTGDRILRDALTSVGIKATGSVQATLTKALAGKSSVERAHLIGRLQDGIDRSIQRLSRDSTDHPKILDLSEAKQRAVKRAIVNSQTELDEVLTRLHRAVNAKMEDLDKTKANIFDKVATEHAKSFDPAILKKQFNESLVQRGIKSQFGPLTESLSSRLIRSENKIAQWFTMNVLETPSGFGGELARGNTAAITAQMWDLQANHKVLKAYDKLLDSVADEKGLNVLRRRILKTGNAKTHKEVEAVSRDINLELNARMLGKTSNASSAVKEFVTELTNQSSKLHDLQMKHRVDGITEKNKIKHYARQAWRDDKFGELFNDPQVGASGLRKLFEQGYIGAGMNPEQARMMANAMIDLKKAGMNRANGRVYRVGDELDHGQLPRIDALTRRLREQNPNQEKVDALIESLTGATGGTPSYTKHRMKVDYSASIEVNGKQISILDLLDQDVPGNFARYSKESTARAAISQATDGVLNSNARMNEMLEAMSDEAIANGVPVNTLHVKDVLGQMMGTTYSGQLPLNARRARDAVALAGMGGLGESQLAELGLAVNRGTSGIVGLMQTATHRKALRKDKLEVSKARYTGVNLSAEDMRNKDLLDELQELTGLYEDMYLLQRYNIHFDQQGAAMNGTTSVLDKMVNTATGGKHQPLLKYLQTRYTGYGVIRTWEDQTAMASLMHDLGKYFRGQKAFTSEARLKDLGILDNSGKADWLRTKFEDGTVSIDRDGKIESLNIHTWSDMDKQRLGNVLQRHASQQVQKSFAGELSPEMANPWVAFMMQFRSYPMLAAEKQQARNAKFVDREAAFGIGLNTISSAGSRVLRAYSLALAVPEDKREQYLERRFDSLGSDTYAYMGIAAMGPQILDLFSAAQSGDLQDEIPFINYVSQYQDAVASSTKMVPGQDMSNADVKNIQTAMPLGTISFMNFIMGQFKDSAE